MSVATEAAKKARSMGRRTRTKSAPTTSGPSLVPPITSEPTPVSTMHKRYNLIIPSELYVQLQHVSKREGTSVMELLRRFIKLGLIIAKAKEDPNTKLIIREQGTDREILLI